MHTIPTLIVSDSDIKLISKVRKIAISKAFAYKMWT